MEMEMEKVGLPQQRKENSMEAQNENLQFTRNGSNEKQNKLEPMSRQDFASHICSVS